MRRQGISIEVAFYFIVVILFYGFVIPYYGAQVSALCNRHFCRHYLAEGSSIIPSNHRAVDLTDNQWREFRSSMILAISAAMAMTTLHEIYRLFRKPTVFFHLLCGICFLIVQHGWHAIVVLMIILVSYIGGKYFRHSKFGTLWAWVCGLSIIFLKESYRLQHYPGFELLQILFDRRYSGLYPWNVSANFLVLRLISFNLDSIWSTRKIEKEMGPAQSLHNRDATPEDITTISHSVEDYSLLTCLAYVLYPPLYIAGPIISFNAYYHYTKSRQQTENVFIYAVRWCVAFFLLEMATSFFPFFAIVKSGLQSKLSPPQLAVFSYVLLKMMWLKFLIIWRFFRLWALADGINPPENMLRCMSNNCSLSDFWKGWHSSFNLWIVRYMYVPLGGRTNQMWNVWPIFLFVAIWHDIEPKLLAWGGLNSIFYILEIIGKELSKFLLVKLTPSLRQAIEVFCSAFYILVLIAINLVGYAIGVGGVSSMLIKMFSQEGILTLISTFGFLAVGVCVMGLIKQTQ